MGDMGIFRTTVGVSATLNAREPAAEFADVMVDTRSEYNWMPASVLDRLGVARVRKDRFETADGRVLERDVGFAMIYAGGRSAATVVVFGESGDMTLLGAISMES